MGGHHARIGGSAGRTGRIHRAKRHERTFLGGPPPVASEPGCAVASLAQPKLSPEQQTQALRRRPSGEHLKSIAACFKVSSTMISRLKPKRLETPPSAVSGSSHGQCPDLGIGDGRPIAPSRQHVKGGLPLVSPLTWRRDGAAPARITRPSSRGFRIGRACIP